MFTSRRIIWLLTYQEEIPYTEKLEQEVENKKLKINNELKKKLDKISNETQREGFEGKDEEQKERKEKEKQDRKEAEEKAQPLFIRVYVFLISLYCKLSGGGD